MFARILSILFLLTSVAQAVIFDVLVLPSDLFNTKENYYGFDEVSEIVANDLIKDFNSSNGKIKSPDLYDVRLKLNKSSDLKQSTNTLLKRYKDSNKLDYPSIKKVGNYFNCKSVLIVSSSVVTNKNSIKRSLWEILNISSVFDIYYPYRLETSIVLLDTVNDIVMWSNNYSTKIWTNDKTVVAPSASQNIMLRFYPKAIRPIDAKFDDNNGGALRFERTIPEKPKSKDNSEPFYGDMIFGI